MTLSLQTAAHIVTGLAYLVIGGTTLYYAARGRGLPARRIWLGTAVLASAEGLHVVFAEPNHHWGGFIASALLALVATFGAVIIVIWMPRSFTLAKTAQMAESQGIELTRAFTDLGSLYQDAQKLEAQKRHLLASIDHDLRAPFTGIMTPLLHLLEAENLTLAQRGELQTILRSSRLLLRGINDLLDVADLDAARLTPYYMRFDAAKLVHQICLNFETVVLARQIRLRQSLPQTLMVDCDPDKLARIVITLLSNALKFTPASGQVEIHLDDDPESLTLQVQDSGPSIPHDERARVFERFRRMELHSGTTLSLALVKEFAELLGGRVEVSDVKPQGSRFTVVLPLSAPYPAEVSSGDPASVEQLAEPALRELWSFSNDEDAESASKPRRVLILATSNAGHDVREALDPLFARSEIAFGNSVSAIANQAPPDLVVFELAAMNETRKSFLNSVVSHPDLTGAPILFLVSKDLLPAERQTVAASGNDYVVTPVIPQDANLRARKLLELSDSRRAMQSYLHSEERDLRQLTTQTLGQKNELRVSVDALRLAHEQAEREIQLKSNLLGMVSHELRTPMTAMQLQLERLEKSLADLPEGLRPLVSRLGQSLRRLSDLDESLLTYTRIDAGRLTSVRESFNIQQLAQDSVESLRNAAKSRDVVLSANVAPSLVDVTSDPQLIRLIIANLLQNAIKFTKRGNVSLEIACLGGKLSISVNDTGPGIAKQHHARIFEPFAQLDKGEDPVPGIGLGLALVREMVSALGGRIELQSELGQGSTFTVLLPHMSTRARVSPDVSAELTTVDR